MELTEVGVLCINRRCGSNQLFSAAKLRQIVGASCALTDIWYQLNGRDSRVTVTLRVRENKKVGQSVAVTSGPAIWSPGPPMPRGFSFLTVFVIFFGWVQEEYCIVFHQGYLMSSSPQHEIFLSDFFSFDTCFCKCF